MFEVVSKLSLVFGYIARAATVGLFFSLTTAIAVLSFALLVLAPFEYSYGQDDLALADVIALALLGLAVWRYFSRGRQCGTSLWHLLQKFAFTLTYITLVLLSVAAVLASAALMDPELVNDEVAGGVDDLLLYGIFCVFIAAIFGATPLPPIFDGATRSDLLASVGRKAARRRDVEEIEPPTLEPAANKEE